MRRTRWAGLVLVVLLGLGGLAACGGDDDGADVRETGDDSSSGSGSGSGTDSGSTTDTTEAPTDTTEATDDGEAATGVEGYCEAVNRYVELLGEAIDDPTSAGAELQEAANDYATAALNLGELSPEDQARFDECAQEAADAAAELGG